MDPSTEQDKSQQVMHVRFSSSMRFGFAPTGSFRRWRRPYLRMCLYLHTASVALAGCHCRGIEKDGLFDGDGYEEVLCDWGL